MRAMAPPEEDVRVGEHLFGEAMVFVLFERRVFNGEIVAGDAFADGEMESAWMLAVDFYCYVTHF